MKTIYPLFLALAALSNGPVQAQLAAPNAAGVTFAQLHVTVKDVEAQKAFWISMMGGTPVKNGPLDMVKFPGVYLTFSQGDPTGTGAGSILNHFGLTFKDINGMIAKWKANNIKVEQQTNPLQGYVASPENAVHMEFFQDEKQEAPVQMDHVHMFLAGEEFPAIQEWYAKTFAAKPGQRPRVSRPGWVDCVFLPGANLSFMEQKAKPLPSKGRTLDHFGFEVANLDEFAKKLEAQGLKLDSPVRLIPGTAIKSAFLTDPWGTSIELTEGLPPAAK